MQTMQRPKWPKLDAKLLPRGRHFSAVRIREPEPSVCDLCDDTSILRNLPDITIRDAEYLS